MLSAFTARPIIELKQRDKSKIETILAHGDRVLVGLNTGSLRIYRLNELSSVPSHQRNGSQPHASADSPPPQPSSQPPAKPTDLLREVDRFSTRAIEQLAIIKEANTLVSLSNYHVSFHDLKTYELVETLSKTKNATCFAVTSNIVKDEATGIPEIISRLAVAVKRRLYLWSWHESELNPDVAEVVLDESVRTVIWANATKLVCGMNSGYVLVDAVSHEVEDIVVPGSIGGSAGSQGSRWGAMSTAGMGYIGLGGYTPKPLSAKLAEGELLLAKDTNTLFITDSGKPIEKRQIPWQGAPESIGYSYPYILALQSPAKGQLEVRNPDTLSLLQTISLPGAAQLHFPPPTYSLAHAGKGFHISSDRAVWKMDATDYDSQVEVLVTSEKYDEAISVLQMLEDALLKNKTETLREVKMRKAEVLFKQRKYRVAMDLFNEDDVHAPPERVLKLYPRIISGDLSEVSEEPDEPHDQDEDVNGKTNGENAQKTESVVEVASSPAKVGGGFTKYLMGGGHRKTNSDAVSITSSKRGPDTEEDVSEAKPAEERALEGKDLVNAVLELNSYLAGTRARLQRVIDPVTGKLKPRKSQSADTEEAFKSLLTHSKEDSEEAHEKELKATFKLVDTTLFRSYMYSRPQLAGSLFRIPNFCDPDTVNEKLLEHNRYNELVDFFYGKKLHRQALELLRRFGSPQEPDEAAPTLHGPQRTVGYLQNLPPDMIDLILEFSEWVLRTAPKLGMEVFIQDTANAESLPRDKVVKFLGDIDVTLEVRYLEYIITELNDMTADFHNRLVELFIQLLQEKPRGEEWNDLMGRLLSFLKEKESRRTYSLTRAFGLIPRDDPAFYEIQAIVLSNMGQHKQALDIYVFKMNDYAKAEEYCNRVYMAESGSRSGSPTQQSTGEGPDEGPPSIYHTLLSLYMKPPQPHKPNLGPALELLSKHGSRLPAASTMFLMPDNLPVQELESYFRGRIRSANSVVNESRVVAGLRKTELVASQALLLLGDGVPGGQGGKNRRVVVSEERICGVCHKRLGGSVVAVLPDNAVVHYGCLNRAGGPRPSSSRIPSWGRNF